MEMKPNSPPSTDGYVYTHTTDRLWNKNRRDVGSNCFGVDVNANFHYQFTRTNDVSENVRN
jgi:hypothetical protein